MNVARGAVTFALATSAVVLDAVALRAQSEPRGFVVTLGADTVQVERFTRTPRRWSGTVVARAPRFRVTEWSLTFDERGRPARYEAAAVDASGTPVLNGATGSLTYFADTVVREAYRNGAREEHRLATRFAPFPQPSLPFLGVSFLVFGESLQQTRGRYAADSANHTISLVAAQAAPGRTTAWFPAADSAELSYFGVARSGYRFDAQGLLLRADWTRTTYAYHVTRTATDQLDGVAARWRAAELADSPFGALSGRDTVRADVSGSAVTIDYGRPRARGRTIWGGLVPWDRVWRLGADMATHVSLTADVMIGETRVPAGRYTLWMVPSEAGPLLIVNRAVNIFGTNYSSAQDLARIPLTPLQVSEPQESLTLRVTADALEIHWSSRAWTVPLRAP